MRKLRTRIIPFVFVLFVVNFLDRANIAFAALTMNKELSITSQQYGFVAGIFFLGYFIFEVPSNLMLHRFGARIWIARILISWGIVAMLTGFVTATIHLYAVRFLLGVAEAGFFPGIVLYLTYWFRQRQLAHAIALFCAANPVANILGSPLSGVILDHAHWLGFASWRWLLILEGLPAILGGVLTYFLLPGRPAEARFLTAAEKDWITAELSREEQQKLATRRITAVQAMKDARVWHLSAISFTALLGMFAMVFWMPQLIKAISGKYSNTTVGLLVMIPYLVALLVMTLVGRSSDRRRERRYHTAIPLVIGAISLLLLGTTAAPVFFSVALWCLAASGVYSLFGPFLSLPNEFLAGYSLACGIALINSIGNLGGFVGPYAMGAISKTTGGFHGGLVCAGVSLFVSAMLVLALRKKTEQQAAGRAVEHPSPAVAPAAEINP
jgi:MFS transporter, ACS family, tartrate transporter